MMRGACWSMRRPGCHLCRKPPPAVHSDRPIDIRGTQRAEEGAAADQLHLGEATVRPEGHQFTRGVTVLPNGVEVPGRRERVTSTYANQTSSQTWTP